MFKIENCVTLSLGVRENLQVLKVPVLTDRGGLHEYLENLEISYKIDLLCVVEYSLINSVKAGVQDQALILVSSLLIEELSNPKFQDTLESLDLKNSLMRVHRGKLLSDNLTKFRRLKT